VLDKEFTQECMVQFTPDVLVCFGQFFAMVRDYLQVCSQVDMFFAMVMSSLNLKHIVLRSTCIRFL
jgi:hypothetical protein